MRLHLQDICDQEFQVMHESVLRLLWEYGVLFEHQEARKLLTDAGNTLDDNGRVHLRPKFVESMLELVPKDGFRIYGRDQSKVLDVAVDSMAFRPSTGAPFVFDYATRRRRDATLQDARDLITLTDALDGYEMVNCVVTPSDAPAGKENVRLFVEANRRSTKPSDMTVMTSREVRAIGRIAAAIRGGEQELRDKPLTAINVAVISPLRCAGEQVEALLECAAYGIPIEVLSSPSMGMTSPITLSGSVAVSIAEVIAALCLVYLKSPGLGIISTTRISPTNMRTASYNYGAPELGMGSALTSACSARYGIPCNLYGFGTVAKTPGAQAEMEKMLSGLLVALGRPHMITGSGVLDNAMITSPEQLVIDNEAINFIKRIRRPVTIDEESIGVDVLMRGMQSAGCLLAEEHTIEHLRQGEMLDCGLGQWDSYQDWEASGRPDIFERAHARVGEILSSHKVEPFAPDLEREIETILEEDFSQKIERGN